MMMHLWCKKSFEAIFLKYFFLIFQNVGSNIALMGEKFGALNW
jgi:hypothetical protein